MNSAPAQKPSPQQMFEIIQQVNKSMFGHRWDDMVKHANDDMEQLIGISVLSKRDKHIFHFALHTGIKYGVAYSHALRNAQKPMNVLKNWIRRLRKKA